VRPSLIAGHSFGGKVALCYARNEPNALQRVWALDSRPGSVEEGALARHELKHMFDSLASMPMPAASREAVSEHLSGLGFSEGLVGWMGTNLQRVDGVFQWKFDLTACEEMVADYWAQDLWPFVEGCPAGLMLDFVRAERGDRWTTEDVDRIQRMRGGGSVALHLLRDSGHWVHVDNPRGLLEIMLPAFIGVR